MSRTTGRRKAYSVANEENEWLVQELLVKTKSLSIDTKRQKQTKKRYKEAMESLCKCPLPVVNDTRALQLRGVGEHIAAVIRKLLEDNGKFESESEIASATEGVIRSAMEKTQKRSKAKTGKKSKARKKGDIRSDKPLPYLPKRRSGGYGILIALHRDGSSSKQQLLGSAQHFCDTSYLKSDAWFAIVKLQSEGYVLRATHSSQPSFELTQTGAFIADRLFRTYESEALSDSMTAKAPTEFVAKYGKGNVEWHRCEQCTHKGFKTETGLRKHIENKHSDSGPQPATELRKSSFATVKRTEVSGERKIDCAATGRRADVCRTEAVASFDWGVFSEELLSVSLTRDCRSVLRIGAELCVLVLLIDCGEAKGKAKKQQMRHYFESCGIDSEILRLQMADFAWALRPVAAESVAQSADECLLCEVIVERKRFDDLSKSVMDGRYSEQKKRLSEWAQVCSQRRVVYLCEGISRHRFDSEDFKKVKQALAETSAHGFAVVRTDDLENTRQWLASNSRQLHADLLQTSALQPLSVFQQYAKPRTLRADVLWRRQLRAVPLLTAAVCRRVVARYGTAQTLRRALRHCQSQPERERFVHDTVDAVTLLQSRNIYQYMFT